MSNRPDRKAFSAAVKQAEHIFVPTLLLYETGGYIHAELTKKSALEMYDKAGGVVEIHAEHGLLFVTTPSGPGVTE